MKQPVISTEGRNRVQIAAKQIYKQPAISPFGRNDGKNNKLNFIKSKTFLKHFF